MQINIRVKEGEYFHKALTLLSSLPPFNRVTPKDLEFYAHLLELNHRLRKYPLEERNRMIFHYDYKLMVCEKMDMPVASYWNLASRLRKAGILGKDGLKPQYIIPKTDRIIFSFKQEEE